MRFNPTDKNAVEHIKLMFRMHPNFWEIIGEIIPRQWSLTSLNYEENATENNESLGPVYDFSAENNLPVIIHIDISTVWAAQNSPKYKGPIYLSKIKYTLKSILKLCLYELMIVLIET